MAAEAVMRIKEAEEQGGLMVKNADIEAKEILRKAESDAAQKREAVITEANKTKAEIIEASLKKAEEECGELTKQGEAEKKRIQNPAPELLESVAQYAIERIVNADGNS